MEVPFVISDLSPQNHVSERDSSGYGHEVINDTSNVNDTLLSTVAADYGQQTLADDTLLILAKPETQTTQTDGLYRIIREAENNLPSQTIGLSGDMFVHFANEQNLNSSTVKAFDGIPRIQNLSTLPYISTISIVVVLAVIFLSGKMFKQLSENFKMLFSTKKASARNEMEQLDLPAHMAMWLISVSSITFFILSAFFFHSNLLLAANIHIFSATFFGFAILLLMKWLLMTAIDKWSIKRNEMHTFATDYFHAVLLLGIFLVPVNLFVIFGSHQFILSYLIVGVILSVSIAILLLIKGILLFYHGIVSLFYVFLYLCIVEIIPLILILKGIVLIFNL